MAPYDLAKPEYRSDINGLRAIAILSVVGFHTFPYLMKGGFVGVDIFFVISGFLISTIIFNSLEQRSFKFVEFYSRRIRRIFPALLISLATGYLLGWFLLSADKYQQLGKHIAGGAGFVSNFILWEESGYFDDAAETKPFLHLWSLGIEEQFYILWPVLLWLMWKRRFNLLTITIAIALISFVLNIMTVRNDPVSAFYSPQTRFWELMMGSILAYLALHKQNIWKSFTRKLEECIAGLPYGKTVQINHGATLNNIISVAGIGLIFTGIFLINPASPFPGWWALLPTIGTVLVIAAGNRSWLNRTFLSNRVVVWFGLISFPLYLWHWLLLSLAYITEGQTPNILIRLTLVIISVLLAWLTYMLVEKPIRSGKHNKIKMGVLLFLMIVIGYVGYDCFKRDGLKFRAAANPPVALKGEIGHKLFHKYLKRNFHFCTPIALRDEAPKANDSPRCFKSKVNGPIDIAIIGNSHAEDLFIGLAEQLTNKNVVYYIQGPYPFITDKAYENIYNYVISDKNITTIFLAAAWYWRWEEKSKNFESELFKTIDKLTSENKKVYLVDDVPNFSFDPSKCKFLRELSYDDSCTEDTRFFYQQHEKYYSFLKAAEKNNPSVKVLKIAKHFCNDSVCSMAKDDTVLYRDNNHLNIPGSKYLGEKTISDIPELTN